MQESQTDLALFNCKKQCPLFFLFFFNLYSLYIYFFTVKKEQPAMQTDVLLDHHLAAPLLRL